MSLLDPPGYSRTEIDRRLGAVPRAARSPMGLLAAYNGNSNESGSSYAGGYGIGFAVSEDGGRSFTRVPGYVMRRQGTGFESGYIKDPTIAFVGRRLFMAYQAYSNAGRSTIGLAVWDDGVPVRPPDLRRQLLDVVAGTWESGALVFPHLHYDERDQKLHLWYSAGVNQDATRVGHAVLDPLTLDVRRDAGNPVIRPDDGENGLAMGCVMRDAETWHLFVGAFSEQFTRNHPVRYSAPAAEGPWTREGRVYDVRPDAHQALTGDVAQGSHRLQVADPSVFEPGDIVYVQDSRTGVNGDSVVKADNWEVNVVSATGGGVVTLLRPAKAGYEVGRGAEVVAVDQKKAMPRSCIDDGEGFALFCTVWHAGSHTYHEELVALATPRLGEARYRLARDRELLIPKTGSVGATRNQWDKTASENMHAVPMGNPLRILLAARARNGVGRITKQRAAALTLNAGPTWKPVSTGGQPDTGLDAWLPAEAGDVIRVTPQFHLGNEPRWVYFDIWAIAFPHNTGVYRQRHSGGTGAASDQGILAWRCPRDVFWSIGVPILFTIRDTDIWFGKIALRPMYRLDATGTRRLEIRAEISYENIGGA